MSDGVSTTTQAVSIILTDVSEAPTFTSPAKVVLNVNDIDVTTAVYKVSASDPDAGTTLTYAILSGGDAALFNINSNTGVITFKAKPDFLQPADLGANNVYDFKVRVSDGKSNIDQSVSVILTNGVETAPVITSPSRVSVSENVANTTPIYKITAEDAEPGTVLTFALVGGLDLAKFAINRTTGEITFRTNPDFERPGDWGLNNTYDLIVQVSDGQLITQQAISIAVTDVNDNAPAITSAKNVSTQENNTAPVYKLTGTDVDTQTILIYSIVGGADQAKFNINVSTGEVTFKTAPDFEAPGDSNANNTYELLLQITDGKFTQQQSVTITVTDVNDNAPVITSVGSAVVAENGAAPAYKITAMDADAGTTLTYSIIGGADQAKFDINATTGEVTFKAEPDFESPGDSDHNNAYELLLQVSDGQFTQQQAVTIAVTNVNDNAPVITSARSVSVSENIAAVAYKVTATDADAGAALVYSIVGGADQAKFNINVSTGEVTFRAAPDFEAPDDSDRNNAYELVLQVSDGQFTQQQSLTIMITDDNDNAPVITSSRNASVLENAITPAYKLTARDADAGATLTYSIVGGADQAKFTINAATGEVILKTAPDYEAPGDSDRNNAYELLLQVSDGQFTQQQSVTITVANVNDNAPVITSAKSVSLPENSIGAIYKLAATDADSGAALVYSIVGGADQTMFAINPFTGEVTFKTAPDRENPGDSDHNNIYDLLLQVSDGQFTQQQTLTITVTDVNDNAPVITSAKSVTVQENIALSAYRVTATDADAGAALSYSIVGGADQARFTINASKGEVSFKTTPDFEAPGNSDHDNTYELLLQVSDGQFTQQQTVTITVTNANDNAPVITSAESVSVKENTLITTPIYTLTATDADGQVSFTYSIVGGADQAKFTINALTGQVTFKASPDFEAPGDSDQNNVYELLLQVSDGQLTQQQSVRVVVLDIDDNAPVISSPTTVSVDENQSPATPVYKLIASDVDTQSILTYSIVGGADQAKFAINSSTGEVTFKIAPDFEAPGDSDQNNAYELVLEVADSQFTQTQTVIITVNDVNDNAPFITSVKSVSVNENLATPAYRLTSSDADRPTTFTYFIIGGADQGRFTIDATTGEVSFKAAPDFEAPSDSDNNNIYELVLEVSDGQFTQSQSVTISVADVNDNAPIISSPRSVNVTVSEAIGAGAAAYTLIAADADAHATLTYSIVGGADQAKFVINASTGEVTFKTAPDFESPGDADRNNAYELLLQVSDGQFTTQQSVTIRVTDVNDNAPIVTSAQNVSVQENSIAPAYKLTATDVDTQTILTYAIVGGADQATFTIDSSTGEVSFKTAPDFEAKADDDHNNAYELLLQVSDGKFTQQQTVTITVTDVNDNAPVVTSAKNTTAQENTLAPVYRLTATDADAGASLTYSIIGGADQAIFKIDSSTGEVTFKTAPDFEAPVDADHNNSYEILLQVSDGQFTQQQSVTILVANANDNAPVITSAKSVSIHENATGPVYRLAATDADAGATLSYAMIGGVDFDKFTIDATTGEISFKTSPDFEAPADSDHNNVYELFVQVYDGFFARQQAITITVANVNDNAPVVTSESSVSVKEGVGAPVYKLTATDLDDGAVLTYSLIGGADYDKFSIDSSSGEVSFKTPPIFDAPGDSNGDNAYELYVQVYDGQFARQKDVKINVTSAHTAPTITSPESISVKENTSIEAVIYKVTVVEADAHRSLTYGIIGGADKDLFIINPDTGEIRFRTAPDYERPGDAGGNQVYDLIVNVSDGVDNTSKVVAIGVVDVAESKAMKGDFNSDGSGDIFLQHNNGDCFVWNMKGTTLHDYGFVGWQPGSDWRAVASGDFNADGHTDLLLQNKTDGACYVWEFDSARNLIDYGNVGWTPGVDWVAKATGDFNGDGYSDVLLQNTQDGACFIWEFNGKSLVDFGFVGWTPGANWQACGVGDFNRDGKSDILLQNAQDGSCFIWELDGANLLDNGFVGWQPGAHWQARAIADCNSDGRSDIILQDTRDGSCFLWELDGKDLHDSGFVGWPTGTSWFVTA